ncbi:hypothetical protein RFZ44_21880, partial [Acinetobacter sp. 163]|nr:hypothetical protein [Acinetobacter sp. 163]
MKEFAAQEGMVIVMETSTGNLRAVVGWKEDKGEILDNKEEFSAQSDLGYYAEITYRMKDGTE